MIKPATLLAHLNLHRKVSVLACTIATSTLGIDFSFAGQAAHAEIVDFVCTGTQTSSFEPGLTLTPQNTTVKVDGVLNTCTSSDPNIISARFNFQSKVVFSCLEADSGPFDVTYRFNNGEYSSVHYATTIHEKVGGNSVLTSNGVVESGKFKGDAARRVLVDVPSLDSVQCATKDGISSIRASTTVTFTQK